MAPPPKSTRPRRATTDGPAHAYVAFSMSLRMAYQKITAAPPSKSPRAHIKHKQSAAASRAPSSAKTIAPSTPRAHQLPDLPAAVACDATHKRLSTEAQLIQEQARYQARHARKDRLSIISDRESLRCLESFPLNITTRPARVERPIAQKPHISSILPKYFPSPPRKLRSPRFDHDATRTTNPANSSGKLLKSIQDDGNSFSDDSDLSEDDDSTYFEQHGLKAGDLLPVGGISLFAHLEEIRVKEARGSRGTSSVSSSLPREASEGTTKLSEEELDEAVALAKDEPEAEEIDEWQHVERSAVLRREILEVSRQRLIDSQFTAPENVGDEVDGGISRGESGIVQWHADPIALADALIEAMRESGIEDGDEFHSMVIGNVDGAASQVMEKEEEKKEGQDEEVHEPMADSIAEVELEKQIEEDEELLEELEEEDDWLHVDVLEDESIDGEF